MPEGGDRLSIMKAANTMALICMEYRELESPVILLQKNIPTAPNTDASNIN